MPSRRLFLKSGLYAGAAGAMASSAMWPRHLFGDDAPQLAGAGQVPKRFVFIHKGNGLLPSTCVPPSFDQALMEQERQKAGFSVDLDGHTLPEWMSPLASHQQNLTILQGISGKMCTTGHHAWCSALGAYKANERLSSILWATVDFELAQMFPSPFQHIELACFPNSGGNSRGNINGIEKGFSARGAQQPNYAFGSPKVAMQELFRSVSNDEAAQVLYQMDREVLDFVAGNESEIAEALDGIEQLKVQTYADSVEDIRLRNAQIEGMSDIIRRNIPELDDAYMDEDVSTIDRQDALTEIALSTLISGMTNVIALTADELGTTYTGLHGVENEQINLHDVGHGKSVRDMEALDVRTAVRQQHMNMMNRVVTRLKNTPEVDGNGTMFDNTMVFYFPDNGETHHSHGLEYPFVIAAGDNCPLNIGRRYIRLPNYGEQGHKTLGNLWTTLLNAYGNPVDHFGAMDVGLDTFGLDQTGAIRQFMS